MYYYSSGYIDDASVRRLQGVVKVEPRGEKSGAVSVRVGGMEARHVTGGKCIVVDKMLSLRSFNPPVNLNMEK